MMDRILMTIRTTEQMVVERKIVILVEKIKTTKKKTIMIRKKKMVIQAREMEQMEKTSQMGQQ